MSLKAYLRIYKGSDLLEVKSFETDQIIIGNGSSVQINLDEDKVSSIHALIEKRNEKYYLCDLGSGTGTLKNGKSIIDEMIHSGDKIGIGSYSLEFYLEDLKPDAPPPSLPVDIPENIEEQPQVVVKPKTQGEAKVPEKTKPLQGEQTNTSSQVQDTNHRRLFFNSMGSVVEIVVSWKERVLETYHFSESKDVILGGHEHCDIYLPIFGDKNIQHRILKVGQSIEVFLAPQMTGELSKNGCSESFSDLIGKGRLKKTTTDYLLDLRQGEVLVIDMPGTPVTLHIRYVPNTIVPIPAPALDLSTLELAGLVMSVFMSILLSLYISVNISEDSNELIELSEPKRQARFIYKDIVPPPKAKRKIKVTEKIPIKVDKVALEQKIKVRKSPGKIKKKIGKIARIRPKNNPKAPKQLTSTRKGSSKKIAKKAGASAATVKKDVSKVGVLGIFGNNGYRNKLDKASSGVGVLQGLAEKAQGGAGETENLSGDKIGRALLDTGRGGQGLSTIGIETIGTKGRASGNQGYGEGGLGGKRNVSIQLGDDDAEFVGRIDKEAIKRVIRSHRRQIRNCYESALNRQPGLAGKLILEWEIGSKGLVSKAKVKRSSLKSSKVENCLLRRLRTWRFPETPDGVIGAVSYPFVFQKN